MVSFAVVPERLALMSVDLQRCFVQHAEGGRAVLERVNRLAEVCRRADIPVIHVRHVLRDDGADMGLLGDFVPAIRAGMLNSGAESSAFDPGLVVDPRDLVLDKPRFGAFYGTELESILRGRGITSIIVSGISADICCDTTTREAHARDFRVFFLSDGTAVAGPNAREVHQRTLGLMGALFAQVISVDEIMTEIEDALGPDASRPASRT